MRRYLRLLALQLRMSVALGAQYRWDFLTQGALSMVWTVLGLVPLYVALHGRPAVAGWTYEQALVVVGWFTVLKGVLDGAVNPSLILVVEHIRKGTLDFVLMKPADAQFLVSTARFEPWRAIDLVAGVAILVWAFRLMGSLPSAGGMALSVALLTVAIAVLYSTWIVVVAAAFWVVRLDNLSYLMSSLFDFGRWPVSIFRGAVRLFFTFVVPIALMTTYPAEALLGRLAPTTAWLGMAGALVFALGGRFIFTQAIGRYTSASS
jgi:viologen exporter family transport system permease protein